MNQLNSKPEMALSQSALDELLTAARMEERLAGGARMAARLDSLACRITSRQLNHAEATELLRQEADSVINSLGELH